MKRILAVFPTMWDARQLEACRASWGSRFDVELGEPDDDRCPWDYDVVGYIDRLATERGGRIDGIFSSSDYPGAAVAAAVSRRLGLPGSPAEAVIRCHHKFHSRISQREAAPEAVPWFEWVDLSGEGAEGLRFPCFVKPVKGFFSAFTRRVESASQLREFLARPGLRRFMRECIPMYNRLAGALSTLERDGNGFIAEGILRGRQATVEGFVFRGEPEAIGVVDSSLHPETRGFTRFDYPSSLPDGVQRRMEELARRLARHSGLDQTMFNIEMFYDKSADALSVIEINPRMAGQFADLYEKVDGTNGYEIALALAAGERPALRRRKGRFGAASSLPLRVYEPVRVVEAPGEAEIRAAESVAPGTLVWSHCRKGQTLADFESGQDGFSYRYAVVNAGAPTGSELRSLLDHVVQRLGFRFERASS